MTVQDPRIIALRAKVDAVREEFDLAVVFHEVWRPAANDADLHVRLGVSYATNAFFVVRLALRREMLLALMRLWDTNEKATSIEGIAAALRNDSIIDLLAAERAARIRLPEEEDQVRKDLAQRAIEVTRLVEKYADGGPGAAVRRKLMKLRHQRLAHRQVKKEMKAEQDPTAEEIESFYQDMSELVRMLLGLVLGLAYDPKDAGEVYRHHARAFWRRIGPVPQAKP